MDVVAVLAVLVIGMVLGIVYGQGWKKALLDWLAEQGWGRGKAASVDTAPVEQVDEAPEPEPEILPPEFGNIRLVQEETTDLAQTGPDKHEFPERVPAVTRFEDFNRRLFVLHATSKRDHVWPDTLEDDFATRLYGPEAETMAEIRKRLRPYYPVIIDTYGIWAASSAQLEMNPDFTSDIIDVYLAIPETQRPVVVSTAKENGAGNLTFLRRGFHDYTLTFAHMRLHLRACLALTLATLIGPAEKWLWYSVARMRLTVIRDFQKTEAQRLENEAANYLEDEARKAKREQEEKNRYVALWKSRVQAITPAPKQLTAPKGEAAE